MKNRNNVLWLSLIILCVSTSSYSNWFASTRKTIQTTSQLSKHTSTLTESEAHNYVNQIISSLEYALHSHMSNTELHALKRLILDNIRDAQYAHQMSADFTTTKRYKKDIIDQFLSSATLQYIEEASYMYTQEQTHNHTLAMRISSSMRNNALAIIAQNNAINFEQLTPFVGHALKRAIADIIKDTQKNVSQTSNNSSNLAVKPSLMGKKYPSPECVVCSEDFSAKIKRKYFVPCGHDVCAACAIKYFSEPTNCPICRTPIKVMTN